MAYLRIFFDGSLKGEVELVADSLSIGRGADNDIRIDNAGVSTHHARIVREGDTFVIDDLGSKNGVFVNGTRVNHQTLNYGDEIAILKHTLKLVGIGTGAEALHDAGHDNPAIDQGATIEIDTSKISELLKQRQSREVAQLLIMGKHGERSTLPLVSVNTKIGRSKECDVHAGGWFAPRLAARIRRKNQAYFIVPEPRGRVHLNGSLIDDEMQLKHGDSLAIRGVTLRFYTRSMQH